MIAGDSVPAGRRRTERDLRVAAMRDGRDRQFEIQAEWEALGMAVRQQSPEEMRRVLKTWSKDALIGFVIRAESDEMKARHRMLNAWADANDLREYALVLPRETKGHEMGHADPFNGWLKNQKGQTLDAKVVFLAGWTARARSDESQTTERQEDE